MWLISAQVTLEVGSSPARFGMNDTPFPSSTSSPGTGLFPTAPGGLSARAGPLYRVGRKALEPALVEVAPPLLEERHLHRRHEGDDPQEDDGFDHASPRVVQCPYHHEGDGGHGDKTGEHETPQTLRLHDVGGRKPGPGGGSGGTGEHASDSIGAWEFPRLDPVLDGAIPVTAHRVGRFACHLGDDLD